MTHHHTLFLHDPNAAALAAAAVAVDTGYSQLGFFSNLLPLSNEIGGKKNSVTDFGRSGN